MCPPNGLGGFCASYCGGGFELCFFSRALVSAFLALFISGGDGEGFFALIRVGVLLRLRG